jgi:hypothetical protein
MTDVLEPEIVTASDLVSVQDYEAAVVILVEIADGQAWEVVDDVQRLAGAPGVVGKRWLMAAAEHLAQKLDRSFRETPRIHTDQQALAMVKGIAQELDKAASALKVAAESLKGAGKVLPGNQAYIAHMAARNVAKQWLQVGG